MNKNSTHDGATDAHEPRGMVTVDWLLEMAQTLDRGDVPLGMRVNFVKRELAMKGRELLAAAGGAPTRQYLHPTRVDALITVLEGECDGLTVTRETAEAILHYLENAPAGVAVNYTDEPWQDAMLAKFAAAGFKFDGNGGWQAELTTTDLLALGAALGVGGTEAPDSVDLASLRGSVAYLRSVATTEGQRAALDNIERRARAAAGVAIPDERQPALPRDLDRTVPRSEGVAAGVAPSQAPDRAWRLQALNLARELATAQSALDMEAHCYPGRSWENKLPAIESAEKALMAHLETARGVDLPDGSRR